MSSKNITRRDFLKGAAAGALGLAAVSLTGCAVNDAPAASKGNLYAGDVFRKRQRLFQLYSGRDDIHSG